ncbi:helix-turn-helix transcriptional regulator [bacterium]|nr:helix-turn-helix transcriptional regulator [bacterium]
MDMQLFAERLKTIRIKRNIGAGELARAVGLNPATLYRYENAEFKSIKESTLETIANYLSVDKDYLAGRSNDQFTSNSLKVLSERKQKIEIHNIIYFAKELMKQDNVTLDGKPIDEDNANYLIDTIELALEMLKRKNK